VRITLNPRWLQTTKALETDLHAKLILGINFEADSLPLAGAEARAFTTHLSNIEALEPGNEPELYRSFGWYRTRAGHEVPGRPPAYDFAAFTRDFTTLSQGLPGPLAGPATGSAKWMQQVPTFITATPRLKLLTLHRYPLQECFTAPDQPIYPTLHNLLSPAPPKGSPPPSLRMPTWPTLSTSPCAPTR
jgi:hypothetical protein